MAKKKDAEQEAIDKTRADAQAQAKAEQEANKPAEVPEPAPFTIAEGKALTSKKGILGPGDEVKPEYLPGGQDTIDKFVKSGHIVKAK